jgi:hypothetical protein
MPERKASDSRPEAERLRWFLLGFGSIFDYTGSRVVDTRLAEPPIRRARLHTTSSQTTSPPTSPMPPTPDQDGQHLPLVLRLFVILGRALVAVTLGIAVVVGSLVAYVLLPGDSIGIKTFLAVGVGVLAIHSPSTAMLVGAVLMAALGVGLVADPVWSDDEDEDTSVGPTNNSGSDVSS